MPLLIWEEDTVGERKDGYRGRLPAGTHLFTIQAPTACNPYHRLFGYLRWKEARTTNCATAQEAMEIAETWTAEWMAALGVIPASPTQQA